ncbi:helix-turn-helix domain-containing protein [Alcaligenaceae bacterium]|nr:helix-turn-helix domain-containing protein [Alcaligenaceae bacterium]
MNADKSSGGALARGIAVLQAFSVDKSRLTAKELMATTGLPKPTLFRLLTALCDANLLRYHEPDGCFMPAPGLASLAAPLLARTSIRQLAFGPMQTLADRVGAQVSLGLGLGFDLVFIELAQAKGCVTVRPSMGSRISLARTATGRAYLSALPEEKRQEYLALLSQSNPEMSLLLQERLAQAQQDLKERGFCVNHGDLNRQIHAVAVPLRVAPDSDEMYVFNCAVPSFELQPDQLLGDVGPRLVTLARSIEAALGLPPLYPVDGFSQSTSFSSTFTNL